MKCVIENCVNHSGIVAHGENSSHRFPKNMDKLNDWLNIVKICTGQILSPKFIGQARICGRHFNPQDIIKTPAGKLYLRADAVPIYFEKTALEETEQFEYLCEPDRESSGDESGASTKSSRQIVTKLDIEKIENMSGEEALVAVPILQNVVKSQKLKYTAKRRVLQQKCRRLQQKVESLEQLLNDATQKNLLTTDSAACVTTMFDNDIIREIQLAKKGQEISNSVRNFSVTLHFYSPRAYQFVRQAFDNRLPHPRTILRWYSSVDGEPGITSETMAALQLKSREAKLANKRLIVGLMMDEVAIRRQLEWNSVTKQYDGSVQFAGLLQEGSDDLPVAREALVFMVTGINESWKIPVAYFLIDSMNTDQKATVIESILVSLAEIGVTVAAFTFDGTATNLSTAKCLGASLTGENIRPYFEHPSTQEPVFVILDPCHMLKLARNTLAAKEEFRMKLNNEEVFIKWEYIAKMNQIQNTSGRRMRGRVADRHIKFQNEKMRVDLAAQIMSRSVAKNLYDLREINDDFKDCGPTMDFILIINNLFDVLNSKNPNASDYKAPMRAENFDMYNNLFQKAERFFKLLEVKQKKGDGMEWCPILKSLNKTGFLGFIIDTHSFRGLFQQYVTNTKELNEIYSYRFSQDHLETFFSAIRSRGGTNNNPTGAQFKAAYKRLIVNNNVRASAAGNCHDFDEVKMLHMENKSQFYLDIINQQSYQPVPIELDYELDGTFMIMLDDNSLPPDLVSAAIVHKNLIKKIKCEDCLRELTNLTVTVAHSDVVKISKIAELEFKQLVGDSVHYNIPKHYTQLVNNIYLSIGSTPDLFKNLCGHILEQDALKNHRNILIKLIVELYLDVKLRNYAKSFGGFKKSLRKKLTKLILFRGD